MSTSETEQEVAGGDMPGTPRILRAGIAAWRWATRTHTVRVLMTLAGAAGLALCMTVLWWNMRQVMDVGGACAEGGPYVIETECPGSTLWMMPLSVLLGLASAALLAAGLFLLDRRALPVLMLAWGALFASLGWNFLEYAFAAPDGPDADWLVCGIVFMLLALPGLAPLVILPRRIAAERGALAVTLGYTVAGGAGGILLGLLVVRAAG